MAKTGTASPPKGRKTKAATPVKESPRRSKRKTSPTKRYDGTETISKVVKRSAVKRKASRATSANVTFEDYGIDEDGHSHSHRAPSSTKPPPQPRGRPRKASSTESFTVKPDAPDLPWTDSPSKKSSKKGKATGKLVVIADREDEDEELYHPCKRQASVGGVRGSIEERITTVPIRRSPSKSPARTVGRPSESPSRKVSAASTNRVRSASPAKKSPAKEKAPAPPSSPIATRTRSRSPKDYTSKSISELGLQVPKTRTSCSPSKGAQQGVGRFRSVSAAKAAPLNLQPSPTKIARSPSQIPGKSPRKPPVKSPVRSRSVSPIKKPAASPGRARSKSPARKADPAFAPAFLKRLKSQGRDGERLRNVEDIFYDDPSSGVTYADADTTMTEAGFDLAADHGILRRQLQEGLRTARGSQAANHGCGDDLERLRLSQFLDDSENDSYENVIEHEDILHGRRRLFDDEDYDDGDEEEGDGRRSPVKRGRSPGGPSSNAGVDAPASRFASMSPRKRGRLGLGQSPLRQMSRAGTSSPTKEAIPRLKGGKESNATPRQSGRGNVISSTNPVDVPGMNKKNPFFETMPGVEVWHRRMPPFLPFGETPFMEMVMSRQINDDLTRGNDAKKSASNSGFLGSIKSLMNWDKNSPERPQRTSPWTLPQVNDDDVNELASTFGAKKRRGSTTMKPASKRAQRRSSGSRR